MIQQNGNSDELLFLQTALLSVSIKGPAFHPALPGITYTEKESSLRIACDDTYELALSGDPEPATLQTFAHAHYGAYRLLPLFFEQQRYELVIEPEPGHSVEFWHENPTIRKCITAVGRKSALLSGVIGFGNEIGFSDLIFIVDGRRYLKLTLEIFPSKISYKDDYKALVADVTSEVYNLVFDFLKKTYDRFDINPGQHSSPVEFFAILRRIYDQFISAADIVISRPHHLLQTEHAVLPGHKVRRTDKSSVRWIEKHPEQVQRAGDRLLVGRTLAVQKRITYDTNENRLTRYMLESTAKRLESFRMLYLRLSRDADDAILSQIDSMVRGIRRRCTTGFMQEVQAVPAHSGMSLVFGMAPGYRELYRCYLLLQHGLSVTGSVFNVSLKDLAVLYEYWCFIKLNSLMKSRYRLQSQDIIRIAGNGLFVSLIKGQSSRVRYIDPESGETITLSYNPKEIKGPTVSQRPDNVLQLEKKGAQNSYAYVFDAKYRINTAPDGSAYRSAYGTPGPQEDDINTMHRYRDAIVYRSNISPFKRSMFGAYVLFPYHNEQEYREHRFYQSIEQVNIGGLPFLPSATTLVSDLLDELISDSPESAFERATLPDGIEERLAKVDWSRREVLVGSVFDDAHMQTFLRGSYYYTYRSQIARQSLPIYYVALYRKNSGIRYYGKVLSCETVNRDTLPGKGRNPGMLCYRFDVEKWIELATPILPDLYGPSPIGYTNLFLLTHSTTYPELYLRNEAEYRFYTELKRRSLNAVISNTDELSGFELNDTKVLFDDGEIRVYRYGKLLASIDIAQFSMHPNAGFRMLQRSIHGND